MSVIRGNCGFWEVWATSERPFSWCLLYLMGEQEAKYSCCIFKSLSFKHPALPKLSVWKVLLFPPNPTGSTQTCSGDQHVTWDTRDPVILLTFWTGLCCAQWDKFTHHCWLSQQWQIARKVWRCFPSISRLHCLAVYFAQHCPVVTLPPNPKVDKTAALWRSIFNPENRESGAGSRQPLHALYNSWHHQVWILISGTPAWCF